MEKRRKTKLGRVIGTKMDKTVVVAVDTFRHHPVYRKTIRGVVRYKAHDERNECGEGDTVRLEETRPLSREKRWRVAEIISKGEVVEIRPVELEVQPEELEVEPEGTETVGEAEEAYEEEAAG